MVPNSKKYLKNNESLESNTNKFSGQKYHSSDADNIGESISADNKN